VEAQPQTIGQRLQQARIARDWSREDLAGALGKSPEWVKSVELGRRRLDSFTVIQAIADVLQVDYTDLLGRPRALGDPTTQGAHLLIPAVRRTLLHSLLPAVGAVPLPLDELRRRVTDSNGLRRHGHYTQLATLLPELLTDTAATAAAIGEADRPAAHHLLAESRHNAAMMAKKLGYVDLAALAAGQAVQAAQLSGDPLLITAMEWTQAEVCMTAGARGEAEALLDIGLDRIDGLLGSDDDTGQWSLWGTLHLVKAVTASQRGRSADAAAHLAEAASAADRDQTGGAYQTEFSEGNQAIHVVHVALELGEGVEALERVARVSLAGMPRERRARHRIDRARAFTRDGDDAAAMREITEADRLSPEGARAHPMVQEMVLTAARRARTVGPIAETARRLHIAI